jgi:aminopeptidase
LGFPDVQTEEQVGLLGDAIFKATCSHLENPVEAWKEHVKTLQEKTNYLNKKCYKTLVYKSPRQN